MSLNQNKRQKKQLIFNPGTTIEVGREGHGLQSTWYEATIIGFTPIKNPNNSISDKIDLVYEVVYKTLLNKDKTSLLKECVKSNRARPGPPVEKTKEDFNLNDIIEAFYLDGWWVGIITNIILPNNNNNNNNNNNDNEKLYEVAFDEPPDVVKFRRSQMRVHLDWIDEKWVQQLPLIKNQSKHGQKSLEKNKKRKSEILKELCAIENRLSSTVKTPSRKGKTLATSDQIGMHYSKRQITQSTDSSSCNVSNEVANVAEEKGLKVYCRAKVGNAAGTFLNSTVQNLPDSIYANGSSFVEQAVVSPAVAKGNRGEVIDPNSELETVKKAASVEPNDDKSINFNHQAVIDPNNEKKKPRVRVSAVEGNGYLIDSYERSLPFLKTRLNFWNDLESMEIFQAIPQKPHFQMLVNECPEAREGKAIGYMMTFSSIVKKVNELRLDDPDDPRRSIEDCLKKLVKLEKNGFDVKEIRDRLSSLLSKKDEYDNLLIRVKEHENQIMEHKCKKGEILEEIGKLAKQKKELQEKCDLAYSMMEDMENKITGLELMSKSALEEMEKFSDLKRVKVEVCP